MSKFKNYKKLIEAANNLDPNTEQQFMTAKERLVKRKLVNLLIDKHHTKYAARLNLFTINIVPLYVDPDFTAACMIDKGTILISEGFLQDEKTFDQLDMLMRHELSHQLLLHQIRFVKLLGEEFEDEINTSKSLNELANIIMDFDISNTRYTEADKKTVRHTMLNGKEISGLVTEDSRQSWLNLSLEDMFDKTFEELEQLKKDIVNDRQKTLAHAKQDFITASVLNSGIINYQREKDRPSRIKGSVKDFLNGNGYYVINSLIQIPFKTFPERIQNVFKNTYNFFTDPNSIYFENKQALQEAIDKISNSKVNEGVTFEQKDKQGKVIPGKSFKVFSPENKELVLAVLKNLVGNAIKPAAKKSQNYVDIFNKLVDTLDDKAYSANDVADLLADALPKLTQKGDN